MSAATACARQTGAVLLIWVWISLLPGITGAQPSTALTPLTLEDVMVKSRVRQAVLSPEGERVAVLLSESRNSGPWGVSLWIMNLDRGNRRKVLESRSLQAVDWSTDGQVIFLDAGARVGQVPASGGRASWIFKLDPELGHEWVDVDISRPQHALLLEEQPPSEGNELPLHRLLRVGADGSVETLFESTEEISSWQLDEQGEPAWLKRMIAGDSDASEAQARKPAQGLFRVVDGKPTQEILRCSIHDPCGLVSADEAAGRLWVRTHLRESEQGGGRLSGDLWNLVTVDTVHGTIETVHQDPFGIADLGPVELDPQSGKPILVSYETDRLRPYGIDPVMEAHASEIRERFPESSVEVSASALGTYWLIRELAPRLHHPRFHVYHLKSRTFREILTQERQSLAVLPETRLVHQQAITYRAQDGMELHGYVWLPVGVDLKKAPTVANIHGGPWNRVRYGFNGTIQFLASRGYVVFQPNFRGSSGYGMKYLSAAKGELSRGAVQQDILDGLNHLSALGYGDPQRRAIAGHSYGGYASLVASIYRGGDYRAAVATAAPIDLVRAFREMDPKETNRNGVSFREWARELFVDLDDPKEVAEERSKAPEAGAKDTVLPLLMMAGAKDVKVAIVGVKHYASLLHEAGKDVTLLVDDEAGHSFETPHMRASSVYLMEQFLARHLGGKAMPANDLDLKDYIEGNLRLIGESFADRGALRP